MEIIDKEIAMTITKKHDIVIISTMKSTRELLSRLNLSDKEITVYLALLSSGPLAIRKIAEQTGINRGTTHEALKKLQREGLVSYYHKEKHQYFAAEDPLTIAEMVRRRKEELTSIEKETKEVIPQLRSLYGDVEERPVVKYYEGETGIKTILQDVLENAAMLPKKEYFVYSSSNIRPYLYRTYANFTEERLAKKIFVKVVAIGEGGKRVALAERRWLTKKSGAPTYTLIYAGKVAMISVDKKDKVHGLIIEDQHIFETQKLIFNWVWNSLKK